ncbi:MAG: hypothetical protein IH993_03405 [Proteobacteria bacterium]|nr:hypothetical protein [Pseudomonadota bacterium]
MSGIEELRQRVSDAVEHFGQINERRATYSQRLIDLMSTVEGRIRDQLREIEEQKSKIAHRLAEIEGQFAKVDGIDRENEQLRAMLHSLLQAIDEGGRDSLAETMHELEGKASALINDGVAEASAAEAEAPGIGAAAEPATEAEPEVADAQRAEQAIEAADDTPAEVIAEAGEPVAEEPAEVAAEIEEPAAEKTAEIAAETEEAVTEEPAGEAEPVAAEGAIATGDILDTPKIAEDSAEDPMAVPDAPAPEAIAQEPVAEEPVAEEPETEEPAAEEPAAEDVVEPAAEAPEPVAKSASPGSLDEIMERVSKLVQETDAAIAAPEPHAAEPAAAPEEPAEETAEEPAGGTAEKPARQASAARS